MSETGRSVQKAVNTLGCLVMSLEGQNATVELHNESYVTGMVLDVDA